MFKKCIFENMLKKRTKCMQNRKSDEGDWYIIRYIIIDQQIEKLFVQYSEYLSNFQKRISANHDKG